MLDVLRSRGSNNPNFANTHLDINLRLSLGLWEGLTQNYIYQLHFFMKLIELLNKFSKQNFNAVN